MNPAEAIKLAHTDPAKFIEKYLYIEDKLTERTIPFKFNNVQRDWFWPAIQKQLREIGRTRMVWLKARRMGASTLRAADMFTKTVTRTNTRSEIISYNTKSAGVIFDMNKLFYDMLPPELQPTIKHDTTKNLVFAGRPKTGKMGLRSGVYITSADDANAGRSSNTRHLHASEVAFWPASKAADVVLSIAQAVPDAEGTSVVFESTAKGQGGVFYDKYWSAKDDPKNEYVAVFVPWYAYNEYQMPLDDGERLNMTPDEKRIQRMFNLTEEQMKWRRYIIANKCDGDIAKFKQEYPATDVEAFEYGHGKSVFSTELLSKEEERAKASVPVWRGEIDRDGPRENANGRFRAWRLPADDGRKYVVGVDPSEGTEDNCYQAIEVIDALTLEHVAEWAGRVTFTQLGLISEQIARFYNNATLVIEANNHGHAVLQHVHYGNTYYRRDISTGKTSKKVGWWTDAQSKQAIIDLFDHLLTQGALHGLIHSTELVWELKAYQWDNTGAGPPQGQFADRLMAYLIALYVAYKKYPHVRAERESYLEQSAGSIASEPQPEPMSDIAARAIKAHQEIARKSKNTSYKPTIAPLAYRK